jgi:hypothetical protein
MIEQINLSDSEQKKLKELKEERITEFKKAFKDMIATSRAAYQKTDAKFIRERHLNYSKEEINRIVQNGDPISRAALSEFFFATNGLYKRIILHYATFLTYSWILVPYVKNRRYKITEKKIADAYYDASEFCTNFQIDRKCALFARDILVKGAYYGLLHDNGNNIVIQDLPFDYCRSRFKNEQDIDIVEFNMAFFDTIRDEQLRKEILATYPKVVQKGYYKFKYHDGPKWLFLPAEMGIYFCYFDERPFFLDLLPLLDDLDDYKEIDKERNLQALKRILVQQVPHDGMKLVFEPDEAEEMHEGALNMMAGNSDIDVLTTYTNVSLLDMSSDDDEKTEVEDVQDLIYQSAGVSKELFSATTDAGIQYSLNNDLAMMMILGQRFAHFFTALLNYKFENKKVKFKLLILPISYYNSADYTSRARELASFGYCFLTPVLSTGIDQTNLAALKTLENDLLNLDEILKPLQSSYTQSGKSQGQPISDSDTKAAESSDSNSSDETVEEDNSDSTSEKEDKDKNNDEVKEDGQS